VNPARPPAVYDDVTDVAALPTSVCGAPDDTFVAFYADTVGPLGGYAFQLVGDPEIAADIVQEAYTRLLARWLRVRKPRPYLFHVVTNLARDAWSARQRADAAIGHIVDCRPALSASPVDITVWDAVERLPARYREIVLLHYYADLPLSDVANAVRRPLGSIKRMVAEARDLLAIALGDVR
jgi:RNA polymerase sigma-70 factor (ECF subfamily)